MAYQLLITLRNVEPPIWRRVIVPSELSLGGLHNVIQIVMGWEDCHLHHFFIKKQRYTSPVEDDFDDVVDERETALRDVIRTGSKFTYEYDFGDSWEHLIRVEKTVTAEPTSGPTCVDGARACPPEDSGGPWGYQDRLEALAHPEDSETEELREWMGDEFDPELFDLASVNRELRRVFRRAALRGRPF